MHVCVYMCAYVCVWVCMWVKTKADSTTLDKTVAISLGCHGGSASPEMSNYRRPLCTLHLLVIHLNTFISSFFWISSFLAGPLVSFIAVASHCFVRRCGTLVFCTLIGGSVKGPNPFLIPNPESPPCRHRFLFSSIWKLHTETYCHGFV